MYALELKNISKTFGGCVANKNITLSIKKAEVHAILGENGAGKSTLMKIIFGIYQSDPGGQILLNGKLIKCLNKYSIKSRLGML